MQNSSIFSFFSGAGFLDLGFEEAGFDIVFVNEFFSPFMKAYKYSRERLGFTPPKYGFFLGEIDHLLQGHLSQELSSYIDQEKKSGKLVGFIGGPPCPDFSIGGKNKGRHGENGKLSQSYVNMITEKKPHFFIFENVKGLIRTNRHREFLEELKDQLRSSGYALTSKVINAIDYGVPQDRERLIMFGIQEKLLRNGRKKFKLDSLFAWDRYTSFSAKEIVRSKKEKFSIKSNFIVPEELTIQYWFNKNNVEKHPNTQHCFVPRAGLTKFETIAEGDDSKKSYKRLHRYRYSPTAAYGNNEVHIHPVAPRRINVAEALAIQSLPANFELPSDMTLTNMFKTIGNGVPFLAAFGIAKTVRDCLSGVSDENNCL